MRDKTQRSIPAHAVDRPALREQLDTGMSSPLSLVVAPAGAGKTVLLSQWARSRGDLAVAWIDVTEADVDAAAMAQRLVDAIVEAAPDFHPPVAPVEASGNRLGEPLLEDLAAGLRDAGDLVVIFDDLDRVHGSPLLTDLWRLVDRLPPSTHFVFSSRIDLKLGWSRHRLEHSLVEIRQRELAFDEATTAHVITAITGRPVSDDVAAAVAARTEGWAAGVQLTALSLRFAADPDRVVDALAETDRLIVDYLSEEVLDAQDADRPLSLMRLAVLDEFHAALVDVILGGGGAELIHELERDSMFVRPVPGSPGWFRFHALFRDLLLLRVRAQEPGAEQWVLRAAAEWCESEGLLAKAVEYRLRAHDWDLVVEGVLAHGREIHENLGARALAGWLAQIPADVRVRHPDAELLLAMTQGLSGDGAVSIDTLRAVLVEGGLTAGQRQIALTYLGAGVEIAPHPEFFADTAQRALTLLERDDGAEPPNLLGLTSPPMLEVIARASLGRALLLLGDLDGAREALREAMSGEGMMNPVHHVHALGSLALVEAFSGRLTVAVELADEALALADVWSLLTHPAPADAYLARAVVAIRRGEPDAGAFALAEGQVRAASNRRTQLLWLADLASRFVDPLQTAGSPDLTGPPPPFVREATAALAMRASRLRGTPTVLDVPTTSWSVIAFEEIAALLALGRSGQALDRLAQFDLSPRSAPMSMIERDLLFGWAWALEGREAQSQHHLRAALDRGAPEGLLSPFQAAGPEVARLIGELPGLGDDFRRHVVHRTGTKHPARREQLAESLTPRELELLAYLPSRMTFADIAAHCFVSINTIKTHIGHIYRKLGVTGRDAAIERAVDLGLVDQRGILWAG